MYKLTKEEIEIPRTPKEHIDWVLVTFNKYGGSHAETVYARSKSTDELKILFEESYPLSKLCEFYFDDNIRLKQIVGNQQYDVIVENHKKIDYIEITQAINGESDKLRMRKLNEDGHVSASDSVYKKQITGKSPNIKVTYEVPDDMKLVKEKLLTELIETVVKKKLKKNYPSKTLLLVVFDNAISSSLGIDMNDLNQFMEEAISPLIKDKFTSVVLVGLTGSYYYEV